MAESIGRRVARLRKQYGWTQQGLAERLAISRVAVSHIEMDLSVPGERTIALMAGWFKMSPHELVAGTTYPRAKADRLPPFVCQFTALEMDLALLDNDLCWLVELEEAPGWPRLAAAVWERWAPALAAHARESWGAHERALISQAQRRLREGCLSTAFKDPAH